MAVCENIYDENGNIINGGNGNGNNPTSCTTPAIESEPGSTVVSVSQIPCPATDSGNICKPWQLSHTKDNCFIDSIVGEALNIAGADVNVFKLLGVHEQTKLVDLTGNGSAISSGDQPGYSKSEAFTTFVTEWHSAQKGDGVIPSAYIGYDFGEIKLENNRLRYGVETSIKHNISSIKIKQSNNSVNRATKVRVERSADGNKWYGAAVLVLPDDNCLNTIHFENSAPMRYWRLRPLEFNGGTNDYWGVQALEMSDYDLTSIEDIQDKIWNENRDRDYASQSIPLKVYYDLPNYNTSLTQFGLELPTHVLELRVHINTVIAALGRIPIVGDIFEIVPEAQFDVNFKQIKQYMIATDVVWAPDSYTPGWQQLMYSISVRPMIASQETADIVGGLESYPDDEGYLQDFTGSYGMDTGTHPFYQDQSDISQTIEEEATNKGHLPERGRDPADITQFSEEQVIAAAQPPNAVVNPQGLPELHKLGLAPRQLYVEDAMPPNGLPYTQGDEFPTNPSNGDYHRLTYTGVSYTDEVPPRLFKWSEAKGRWLFLEKDKRAKYRQTKPVLDEFYRSEFRTPPDKISK